MKRSYVSALLSTGAARSSAGGLALLVALAGCREPAPSLGAAPERGGEAATAGWDSAGTHGGDARAAVAVLQPVGGGAASGTVRLTAYPAGVRVLAEVEGLGDDGLHALHVLAATSCAGASDAPLFDPDHAAHGSPYEAAGRRRAGGLGNLEADDGRARYDRLDPLLALDGPRSALGRAVVVRAGQDDFVSEPAGGAGDPLACGVLGADR